MCSLLDRHCDGSPSFVEAASNQKLGCGKVTPRQVTVQVLYYYRHLKRWFWQWEKVQVVLGGPVATRFFFHQPHSLRGPEEALIRIKLAPL